MSFLRPTHPSLTHLRTFTCTAPTLGSGMKKLARQYEHIPAYPYGPSQFYKQSNFGLYGNQKIRYGNIVSEKNEVKTRRYWRPNVQSKRLWSDALQHFVRMRITTRVLRTVDKVGGLDEYLLGEKAGRLKELGMGGWRLRWRLMQSDKVKERFRKQRIALGMPHVEQELKGITGKKATKAQIAQEVVDFDNELKEGEELDVGETEEGNFMEEDSNKPAKILA